MVSEMDREVGKKLRLVRRRSEMSQGELGAALGLSHSAISLIEKGESQLSVEHLWKLPRILNCRISELLPDVVLTEYDRRRAKDPRLQQMIELWPDLSEAQQSVLLLTAESLAEGKRKQ